MKDLDHQWILIIDDDHEDHQLVRESLAQIGMDGNAVSELDGKNGLERLEQMQQNPPSLIILDFNMPGMNGLDVLGKIKERYDIPVLIHTTSCTEELTREAKNKGALDCIQKCTSASDIFRIGKTIEKLLKSNNRYHHL